MNEQKKTQQKRYPLCISKDRAKLRYLRIAFNCTLTRCPHSRWQSVNYEKNATTNTASARDMTASDNIETLHLN